MTADRRTLLLFDLGNVIVDVVGAGDIRRLLTKPESAGETWPALEIWNAFEMGQIEPEEFARRIVSETAFAVEAERFLVEFDLWCGEPFPGVAETLGELAPRFRLAALSNSNAVHWRRLAGLGMFERMFSSHELGMRKPQVEAYEHVLRELDVRPEQATFFDDLQVNVDAARRVGMQAFRVEGPHELRACLRELGYLTG